MNIKKVILNKHTLYVTILLIISIFVFKNILHGGYLLDHPHFYLDQKLIAKNILESVFEHKSMYLWDPYTYGGNPFFGHPETYFVTPTLILLLITKNLFFALNATLIFHLFLMGLGMYLLVLRFTKNKESAFLSAIIYMFNSYSFNFGVYGNLSVLIPISFAPFVFLFMDKALHIKKWVGYVVITSIFLSMILHGGGIILWVYIVLLILFYTVYKILTTKNISKNLFKLVIFAFIIIITILLSAVKIIPSIEFSEKASRQDISYQYFLEGKLELKDMFKNLVFNIENPKEGMARIGVASYILMLFCIPYFKKKKIIFFFSVMILSILIATGSFLTYIMYKLIPFYSQLKHPERSLILFVFAGAILGGFGFKHLVVLLKKKIKIAKILFFLFLIILMFEFSIIDNTPKGANFDNVQIQVLDNISKDEERFRLHILQTGDPFEKIIGDQGQGYAIDYDIPMIIGGGTVWLKDYIRAPYLAESYKNAKLWGILNVKYLVGDENFTVSNITLIDKFEECLECRSKKIGGPYLYKNELFLPRAYLVDNAILIAGNNIEDTAYSFILHPNFDPSNTIIVMKEGNINKYSFEYIKKFNVLILTQDSIDENTNLATLKRYSDSGGIIMPNILENQQSVSSEEINSVLRELKGDYSAIKKMNTTYYSPNRVELNLDGKTGFLVISEKYYLFPNDWTAKINGKEKEILRANGVISAVYLEGEKGNIVFEYKSKSFITGSWISLITLLLIISYFIWFFYKKEKFKFKTLMSDHKSKKIDELN